MTAIACCAFLAVACDRFDKNEPVSGASTFRLSPDQRARLAKAAIAGDAEAAYNLANHYAFTEDSTKSSREAMEWYTMGAERGHAPSINGVVAEFESKLMRPEQCELVRRLIAISAQPPKPGASSSERSLQSDNLERLERIRRLGCGST